METTKKLSTSEPKISGGDSQENTSNGQRIKTLCVFCGSSVGKNSKYEQDAKQLGSLLVERGITLVYGGGNTGLMQAVAGTVRESGGEVIGIIPHALAQVNGNNLNDNVVVDTMHDRKALMNEKADALIALPGGFGTLEELVETITWSQLRIHSKPVGVLNTNNYFLPFIDWINQAVMEGFIDEHSRNILVIRDTPEALLDALETYEDPIKGPWLLQNSMWKKRGKLDLSDI